MSDKEIAKVLRIKPGSVGQRKTNLRRNIPALKAIEEYLAQNSRTLSPVQQKVADTHNALWKKIRATSNK